MTQVTRRTAVLGAGAALAVGACAQDDDTPKTPRPGSSGPGEPAEPAASRKARPLVVKQSAAERRRTRDSLRQIDEHPMYALQWRGAAAEIDSATKAKPSPTSERSPFGCTLFVALGRSGRPLVGRNFDWDPNPAAVVDSQVHGGPRSLSVSDLSFIGYPTGELDRLRRPDGRDDLTRVQAAVVDGMNEHGLFIGLAADYGASVSTDRGRRRIGGVSVQRMVLDHARTVDAAVAVLDRYDLDFTGGPPLHYLLADATGSSVVVEIHRGRLTRIPPAEGQRWQVLENFHMAGVPAAQRDSYSRYSTCARTLARADGRMTEASSRRLMKAVKQHHTQWSAVYDLAEGTLAVFTAGDDGTVHRFRL